MTLKIFLDTEFTDFVDTNLVSLGMAAETGEEFYAEVPYPHNTCSTFVRETVIPLLGRMQNAHCAKDELRSRILTWLQLLKRRDEEVEICFDFQMDWDLFIDALDYRVPDWCRQRLVANEINELLRYEFYQMHKLPEHHALYDALANLYAFREKSSTSINIAGGNKQDN
jgi:hypothetical protein